jgi:hypothetical protein
MAHLHQKLTGSPEVASSSEGLPNIDRAEVISESMHVALLSMRPAMGCIDEAHSLGGAAGVPGIRGQKAPVAQPEPADRSKRPFTPIARATTGVKPLFRMATPHVRWHTDLDKQSREAASMMETHRKPTC